MKSLSCSLLFLTSLRHIVLLIIICISLEQISDAPFSTFNSLVEFNNRSKGASSYMLDLFVEAKKEITNAKNVPVTRAELLQSGEVC